MFAANEAATADPPTERTEMHVQLTANVAGPGRTETLMGRSYRVVPATLVRSQVLHNNIGACYLAAEDITPEWAEMANGAPVVIDHPTRNGKATSAREPEVLNERGVGALYRTRAQSGALKAEVFLAEDLAGENDELAAILHRLDAGETVELSTGFPAVGEEVEGGVHNGESYELRLYPTGFDHLAVFADKVGACSTDDGCGLGVLNEDAEAAASGLASRIWAHLRALVTEQQDDEWSLDDLRDAVHEALKIAFGADDRWVYIEELFEDSVVYGIDEDGGERKLFRAPYAADPEAREATLGESVEVEKITEFVPVAENESGATGLQARHEYLAIHEAPQEGDTMKRAELIAALCGCDDVAFRKETLEAMNDEELAHVANEAGVPGVGTESPAGAGEEKPGAEEAVANPDDEEAVEEPEGAGAEPSAENEKVPAWAKALQREVALLREATEPARNEQAAERKRLTSDIVANTDLEEADLRGEPLGKLQKLHRATCKAKPQTYVGLGLPRRSDPSTRSVDLGFEVRSTLSPSNQEA